MAVVFNIAQSIHLIAQYILQYFDDGEILITFDSSAQRNVQKYTNWLCIYREHACLQYDVDHLNVNSNWIPELQLGLRAAYRGATGTV